VIVVEHDEDAIRPPTTCSTSARAPASRRPRGGQGSSRHHGGAAVVDRQVSLRELDGADPGTAGKDSRRVLKLIARAATT